MPTPTRSIVAGLMLVTALLAVPAQAVAAGPASIDLGRATPYAVLAGAGVGASGSSLVTGDVGAYPRPAISGQLESAVRGAVHHGGPDAQAAQASLGTAYAQAAARAPTGAVPGAAVDGTSLQAGTYALGTGSAALGGRLVLDGANDRGATWILQVAADLVIDPGSTIDLVNGAQACNVFWQVGGTATLGADSSFAGTVLATGAVSVGAGATVDGRLLSMAGPVLLGGGTVTVPACTTADAAVVTSHAAIAAADAAVIDAPPAVSLGTTGEGDRPSILPTVAIAALVLAALLGEPRPRPVAGPR